jgi:hypothetical protein
MSRSHTPAAWSTWVGANARFISANSEASVTHPETMFFPLGKSACGGRMPKTRSGEKTDTSLL